MAGLIDIGTVLGKLNDTYDEESMEVKTFGLRFLNREGETRELTIRKNVKNPMQQAVARAAWGKEQRNLQRHGVMLVQAEGEEHPRTIKTAMIYGFRDFNSATWLNVFH